MRGAGPAPVAGLALGSFGPVALASAFVPLRSLPGGTTAAFAVLAVTVFAAAGLARAGGAVGAFTATLSFDFYFSRPYLVLDLDWHDNGRSLLVFVVAALAGATAARRSRGFDASAIVAGAPRRAEPGPVRRVLGLIADEVDPRDLVLAVQAELTSLLVLQGCRYYSGQVPGSLPELDVPSGGDLSQLAVRLELPVRAGAHALGVYVLETTPGTLLTPTHIEQARLLGDLLAVGIAPDSMLRPARRPARPHSGLRARRGRGGGAARSRRAQRTVERRT
ncbi:MAG: hypothetical protein ACT4PW_12840 [Acidimicrobiia bacterium]